MSETAKRFATKGVFPPRYAFTLLIPLRNLILSPGRLIGRLELNEDSNVLEVGPGPGYFSVALARTLKRGRLVLADIQQEMLDYARKRLDGRGLANVEYCLCDGLAFPFPDESFDRILMVTVLGEVENKTAYMREFHRILRADGILSTSELWGDPDRMTEDELSELAQDAGFKLHRRYGSRWNYTVNFKKE